MAVNPPSLFTTTPTPPEDWLRFIVTLLFSLALVGFLAVFLYASFAITGPDTWKQAKEALGLILPPVTGTLGTVLGFYFGNRKAQQ
jgi:hypothetical protein